ncbi:ABC transporter permease [Duganella sp. FT92W]|uniref:ABC transporter permease n=1 Tax=Pseudoduganella rivuli TaxID=2666085 RepID=A0A7X2LT97_9BURK|nr:ABC transporter permease [Pseudoduganella rivuli]MRV72738.1 ABC transporter permease [Pseudoduganella rivuli]
MNAMLAIRAIGRCTVLEAWRGRLPWVMAALGAAALGIAGFARLLALAEGDALYTALLGALLRLACAGAIAAFAVLSVMRETLGRGMQMLMAMALPRSAYVAGKFAGLALLAVPMALASGVLLAVCAAPQQTVLWTVSLLCELWLAAGFGLLCALALAHPLPALAAATAFYLLARMGAALHLAAQHSLQPDNTLRHWLVLGFDAIATLLPRLDLYTRASWLIYGDATWATVASIGGQTALYLALLGAAALFDLRRKEL